MKLIKWVYLCIITVFRLKQYSLPISKDLNTLICSFCILVALSSVISSLTASTKIVSLSYNIFIFICVEILNNVIFIPGLVCLPSLITRLLLGFRHFL